MSKHSGSTILHWWLKWITPVGQIHSAFRIGKWALLLDGRCCQCIITFCPSQMECLNLVSGSREVERIEGVNREMRVIILISSIADVIHANWRQNEMSNNTVEDKRLRQTEANVWGNPIGQHQADTLWTETFCAHNSDFILLWIMPHSRLTVWDNPSLGVTWNARRDQFDD